MLQSHTSMSFLSGRRQADAASAVEPLTVVTIGTDMVYNATCGHFYCTVPHEKVNWLAGSEEGAIPSRVRHTGTAQARLLCQAVAGGGGSAKIWRGVAAGPALSRQGPLREPALQASQRLHAAHAAPL